MMDISGNGFVRISDDVLHIPFSMFNHVMPGDKVDKMWGYSEGSISLDDIKHLMQGGCLYTTISGEYALVIALCENVANDED